MRYALSHLSDHTLLHDLATWVSQDRRTTADMLAHIAEVDVRKLYLPAAYPSMFAYCVGELRLCEQAAYRRIQAARVARKFPAIFDALAEGRLHLSAVVLMAPHLAPESAPELLAAATHKTKSEVEQLLAERYPRPDVPDQVRSICPGIGAACQLAPGRVENGFELSPGTVAPSCQLAPGQVGTVESRPTVKPLAPERFALQVTIGQDTYDKLQYARSLLGHSLPAGEIAIVFDRALDLLIRQLEQRKFAATASPRNSPRRSTTERRHIPAHVRRTVWERDGGQCTFVSGSGRRCAARTRLEFDHMDEVARGGAATVERMRLRCRAHNQYAAECSFGAEFMRQKREHAAEARAARAGAAMQARAAQARAVRADAARPRAEQAERERAAAEQTRERDVIPWLRALGFRMDEARGAAALCEQIPDAPLEERVRAALTYFKSRSRSNQACRSSLTRAG